MINIRPFQAAMLRRAQSAFDRSLRTVKSTFALVQPQPRSHPNHNSDFYDFMTVHMPDWKERKKQLDTEVVQSL